MAETIKSYVDKANAAFASIGQSADELVTGLTGVTGDVTRLKEIIVKLQNNPGPISAEDQALLDQGVPLAEGAVNKLKDIAATAKALDEATAEEAVPEPPVIPQG